MNRSSVSIDGYSCRMRSSAELLNGEQKRRTWCSQRLTRIRSLVFQLALLREIFVMLLDLTRDAETVSRTCLGRNAAVGSREKSSRSPLVPRLATFPR